MRFNKIQPLALRVRPDAEPLMRDCITQSFPKHWAEIFTKLQATVSNRPPDKVSLPISSLNRTLRALLPEIISINRNVTSQWAISNGKPWLYVQSQVDAAILINVVHAWARVVFKDAGNEELNRELARIQTHDINWQIKSLELTDWKQTEAGTAIQIDSDQYILFPDYVSATLSQLNDGFQYGGYQLHFRRSSLPVGQQGAELTSWPPQDNHSVVLTLTMQTVPFQAYPVLHCNLSLRRWAGPKRASFSGRASVYLSSSLPFIPQLQGMNNQLQVASIQNQREADTWKSVWSDQLVDILALLRSEVALIDANELSKNPTIGQHDLDNAALIVYSTRMKSHKVGAGVAIPERSQLFDQISNLLDHVLEPVAPLSRVKILKRQKSVFPKNPFLEDVKQKTNQALEANKLKKLSENNAHIQAERRALLAKTVGKQLSIEIRSVTEAVQAQLSSAIETELGVPACTNQEHTFTFPEISISLQFSHLNGLTDDLGVTGGKGVTKRVQDATQRRMQEIKKQLPSVSQTTLTLAEIPPKQNYGTYSDPKSALRIGLAHTGRFTQFITPDMPDVKTQVDIINVSDDQEIEETDDETGASLKYRAKQALLDGLRQLGVPGKMPITGPKGRPCVIIGIWLINKNATRSGRSGYRLPVLVRLSSADNAIDAIAPGFDDWLPYREALLQLAKINVFVEQRTNADYTAYIKDKLEQNLAQTHDTLLVCHAQNLRGIWPWLMNGNILRDAVSFNSKEQQANSNTAIPISELSGLRIVRVRDAQSHETPECFADAEDRRSVASGIFQIGERVFGSLQPKPKQFTKYSHYFSKAGPWTSPTNPNKYNKADLGKSTWNPVLYELTVAALQPEDKDDPLPWVQLVHDLRQSTIHYSDATALPLPLHLAKLMEEYILSIPVVQEEE